MIPDQKSRLARTEKIPKQFVFPSDRYTITETKVVGVQGPKLDRPHGLREHSDAISDLDFMMPARVREVLESEGLRHKVIDKTIGQSEKDYKFIRLQMAEQNRQRKRSKVRKKTKDSSEDKSVKFANRREKRESRGKPWAEHPVSSQQPKEEALKLCKTHSKSLLKP